MKDHGAGRKTHVVFGRTAPLLNIHHFDVQHSPELHPDPAEVMHRGVRRQLLRLQTGSVSVPIRREQPQHSSRCRSITSAKLAATLPRWLSHHRSIEGTYRRPVGATRTAECPGDRFSHRRRSTRVGRRLRSVS